MSIKYICYWKWTLEIITLNTKQVQNCKKMTFQCFILNRVCFLGDFFIVIMSNNSDKSLCFYCEDTCCKSSSDHLIACQDCNQVEMCKFIHDIGGMDSHRPQGLGKCMPFRVSHKEGEKKVIANLLTWCPLKNFKTCPATFWHHPNFSHLKEKFLNNLKFLTRYVF